MFQSLLSTRSRLFSFLMLLTALGVTPATVHAQVSINPAQAKEVSSAFKGKVYRKLAKPIAGNAFQYNSADNPKSYVTIQWSKGANAKDDIKRTIKPLTGDMCLTREEVRGQKVENEIVIPDGSTALQLLPGGVFDSNELLKSGNFKYSPWSNRKEYTLSASSNLAKKKSSTVRSKPGSGMNEGMVHSAVHELTSPSNISGTPNATSSSEVTKSTFQESIGLSIGGSFFYMGISAENNFSFSSDSYRYMYIYQFDQKFLSVIAEGANNNDDLFIAPEANADDMLYVREVKYGRRLYVIMESEYDLEKHANEFNGSVNWAVVSAKLKEKNKAETWREQINLRIVTQGGQSIAVTSPNNLEQKLEEYFKSSYDQNDIVPLSFKVTDLKGTPVSITTKAFLDGDHCLTAKKARVRLASVSVIKADDGADDSSEQLYGATSISLFNKDGKQVGKDGKSIMPKVSGVTVPTAVLSLAKEDFPIVVKQGMPKTFGKTDQAKFIDLPIFSLDTTFQLVPGLHEKDDFGDDDFGTDDKLKKTLRQMLIDGSTTTKFEFRHDKSVVEIVFEIEPIQ